MAKISTKLNSYSDVADRIYPIAAATSVISGQFVKLTANRVVSAVVGETSALIGVMAEQHGTANIFDTSETAGDSKKCRVIDGTDVIYSIDAPKITATGGTTTTIQATGIFTFADDDFNGGYAKLYSKGSSSTNTDKVGTIYDITDFAIAITVGSVPNTFTISAAGGAVTSGDVFEIFPPRAFAKGNLDSTLTGLDLVGSGDAAALPIQVVGEDIENSKVEVMIKKHTLGVSA